MKFKDSLEIILLGMVVSQLFAVKVSAQNDSLFSHEEAWMYLQTLIPKAEDYKFSIPHQWSENLISDAVVVETSSKETKAAASNILDGDYTSCWKTNSYEEGTYCIIDLGEINEFDRLVIFNVFSEARGTGGGNNSLKKFAIEVSIDLNVFKSIGEYEIAGPKAVCVKIKDKGGMCTFINNSEPEIIELPSVSERFIKIILKEAYWEKDASEEWKSSYSISEVMLFNSTKW